MFLFIAGHYKFCVYAVFAYQGSQKAGLIRETFFNYGYFVDQWVFLMITRMGNMRLTLFPVSIREVVALVMAGRVVGDGRGDGFWGTERRFNAEV